MGEKREDEIISFNLHKEIAKMICMLMPLALYQYNLLSLFHFVLLGVLFFDMFFLSADKIYVQAALSSRRKTRKPRKRISKCLSRNKHFLNPNGTYTEIGGFGKDKLLVSTKEIAKGSDGIIIFEGKFQGRKVAVKRLCKALHNVARKEVQNLIASDQHPNIVRFHCVRSDKDYMYLALEHCICSLSDLISQQADSLLNSDYLSHHQAINMQNINLWKSSGYPSTLLLKIMRDMVNGLVHLHDLGISHQDIKPQNVMIADGDGICGKLSDIGIRRSNKSSSLRNAAGWGARKRKLHKPQTWAEDMYCLGRIFFFCLTRGGHPFDHQLNRASLHLLEHMPEALDLLSRLLHSDPEKRPQALQVLRHPFFWDSEKRLSFLRDVSDRLKLEGNKKIEGNKKTKKCRSKILVALERGATRTFGDGWDKKMEPALIQDITRCWSYRYNSVQQLLRVVRNKLNHYHESPPEIQELLDPMPEGIDNYFSSRFPRLLMEVYKVVSSNCRTEKCFERYFGVDPVPIV